MEAISQLTAATASPEPQIDGWDLTRISSLPVRLDETTRDSLMELLACPLPQVQPASDEHYERCMKAMDAMLPMRRVSEATGELMWRIYQRKLGMLSEAALTFLSSTAIDECEWFPTVAECKRILERFVEPQNPMVAVRSLAAARLERDNQDRFTDAMADLERRALDQTAIDALPEKWKAIAAEKCFLWRWPDGRFTRRADMERLSEDAQAAERERLADMFAEWVAMAEQAAGSAAA